MNIIKTIIFIQFSILVVFTANSQNTTLEIEKVKSEVSFESLDIYDVTDINRKTKNSLSDSLF